MGVRLMATPVSDRRHHRPDSNTDVVDQMVDPAGGEIYTSSRKSRLFRGFPNQRNSDSLCPENFQSPLAFTCRRRALLREGWALRQCNVVAFGIISSIVCEAAYRNCKDFYRARGFREVEV
jgi:hypothetical protein